MNIERELGTLEISFGTSLALEGAMGVHPDRPLNIKPIDGVKFLWVNVSTLLRNIYGSLNKTQKDVILADDLLEFMLYEISVVDGYVTSETKGAVKTIFYRNKHDKLSKYLPNVNLKKVTTTKQQTYKNLHDIVLDEMPSLLDGIDYREYDVTLKGSAKAMMLTHSPVDLLSYMNFSSLALLESRTGKVKAKNTWCTKLGSKFSENMPFNGFTLQVFGDGGDSVAGLGLKCRREVVSMAERDRWTPVTTPGRIKMSVDKVEDPQVKESLLEALVIRSFST